ncbi:hypothetical protein [Actinomadura nitritigenes]|uniref:hypothetical protein n=1 Tax=Actinomadura nitritigenes TaxID=134602 RepID=UPI001FB7C030|nr:hypothetical protein [Actinomadura nitritigenes]
MIADAGSRNGTGGTSTSPAPSIPRRADPLEPVPRVPPRDAVRPELPDPPVGSLRDPPGPPDPPGPLDPGVPEGTDGPDGPVPGAGAPAGRGAGRSTDVAGAFTTVTGAGATAATGTTGPDLPEGGPAGSPPGAPVTGPDGGADDGPVTGPGGADGGPVTGTEPPGSAGGGSARGAIPHTSQKPSSPTSPVQPGWVHRVIWSPSRRSRAP